LKYSPLSQSGRSVAATRPRCGASSARRARTPSSLSYGSGAPATSLTARTICQSGRASPTRGTAACARAPGADAQAP